MQKHNRYASFRLLMAALLPPASINGSRDRINSTYSKTRGDLVDNLNMYDSITGVQKSDRSYYTYQGILMMGSASLDIGSWIGKGVDFKVFAKVDYNLRRQVNTLASPGGGRGHLSWIAVGIELPDADISAITVSGGSVFIGSRGRGVWHATRPDWRLGNDALNG